MQEFIIVIINNNHNDDNIYLLYEKFVWRGGSDGSDGDGDGDGGSGGGGDGVGILLKRFFFCTLSEVPNDRKNSTRKN